MKRISFILRVVIVVSICFTNCNQADTKTKKVAKQKEAAIKSILKWKRSVWPEQQTQIAGSIKFFEVNVAFA